MKYLQESNKIDCCGRTKKAHLLHKQQNIKKLFTLAFISMNLLGKLQFWNHILNIIQPDKQFKNYQNYTWISRIRQLPREYSTEICNRKGINQVNKRKFPKKYNCGLIFFPISSHINNSKNPRTVPEKTRIRYMQDNATDTIFLLVLEQKRWVLN